MAVDLVLFSFVLAYNLQLNACGVLNCGIFCSTFLLKIFMAKSRLRCLIAVGKIKGFIAFLIPQKCVSRVLGF